MNKRKRPVSRRRFLSTTIGGIAGAGLLTTGRLGAQEAREGEKEKKQAPLIYRTLGNTGIKLPIVSMGVMNADNPEVVRASYDLGVRHFDTAAYYQSGNNERMVGKVIRELGVRDKVIIATKIYTPDMRGDHTAGEVRRKMFEQIELSLERLQMDRVDILYVHNIRTEEEMRSKAILNAMKDIRESGKTRHIGVSFHQDLHRLLGAAVDMGGYEVILTPFNMTMSDYGELRKEIARAAVEGIGVIAMKTQAGSARRSTLEYEGEYSGSTVATAALKWVLRNPEITTAIPGYTTFQHMEEDFSVARGIEYDEQERKLLGECDIKLGMNFCRQCGLCMASCPEGVEIPALMRTHMYAARYSNFGHARLTLGEIEPSKGLERCLKCDECRAVCRNSVDIAAGIDELRLIYG